MRISNRFRRVCFPPLVLIALALVASPCSAVTMRLTAGFDGVIKSTRWTPVAVQLANPSDDDIEGLLVVDEPEGLPTPVPICTSQVNLPAHSTKLYHAYVRLPGYGGKIRVALRRGYGTLATREVKVNAASEDDRLIVSVGDRASRLSFLQGESIQTVTRRPGPRRASSSQGTINAGSLDPSALPDRPAAYEGADVIVISSLSPESTDPNALKAMCSWVASGGTLVVSTGPDYKAYMNPFYDEILPVSINGAANVSGIEGVAATCGAGTAPTGPAAIAKSAVKPGIGHIIVSQSGVPLIVERQYGAGKVVFLAFDIKASPFSDWNGQIGFWKSLLEQSSSDPIAPTESRFAEDSTYGSYPGYQPEEEMSSFRSLVGQTASVKTPSIITVGFFLLAYLVILVPVNYTVLRVKRRLELAWLTTPAIVLLFTLGAYAIGYTMKGGSLKICEATLVEGSSNARFARVVTDASVFSPARRSYEISIAEPSAISQSIPTSKEDEPPTTYLADTSVMDDVPMAMWSSKTFEAVGGADLGGVIVSNLKLDGGKLSGTVTNNTGVDLKDCMVYCGNDHTPQVRLPKGGSINVELTSSQTPGPQRPPYYPYQYDDMKVIEKLKAFAKANGTASGPVLIGFADAKGVFDAAGRTAAADRATCYVFHLDYAQGNSISISPSMIDAFTTDSNSGYPVPQSSRQQGMVSGTLDTGGSMVGVYRLPVPSGFAVTSMRLVGAVDARRKMSGNMFNCKTGKWDGVDLAHPGVIANAADHVSRAGEVKIKFSSPSTYVTFRFGLSAEAKRL